VGVAILPVNDVLVLSKVSAGSAFVVSRITVCASPIVEQRTGVGNVGKGIDRGEYWGNLPDFKRREQATTVSPLTTTRFLSYEPSVEVSLL
jgi:hypothetical protein